MLRNEPAANRVAGRVAIRVGEQLNLIGIFYIESGAGQPSDNLGARPTMENSIWTAPGRCLAGMDVNLPSISTTEKLRSEMRNAFPMVLK